jgi:hypothetical protein
MCSACNTTRTQAADREFDHFHQAAYALISRADDPALIFDEQRYEKGSEAYLSVFRYFAKLLCCHLAEIGAPRPRHISRFALGDNKINCVWLAVDQDWAYKQRLCELGEHPYAAHGGLVVYGNKKTGAPNAFHSTLTIGPLRYVFFSRLNVLGQLELRLCHRTFYDWCREQVQKAMKHPLSATEKLLLGLSAEEPHDE